MTAVDVLHDRVLPFYEEHQVDIEHLLTDNGREYCELPLQHPYEPFLAISQIAHRKTQVRSPETNGFCERSHRTLKEEFFATAFRKTLCEAWSSCRRTRMATRSFTTASAPTRAGAPAAARPIRPSGMPWAAGGIPLSGTQENIGSGEIAENPTQETEAIHAAEMSKYPQPPATSVSAHLQLRTINSCSFCQQGH